MNMVPFITAARNIINVPVRRVFLIEPVVVLCSWYVVGSSSRYVRTGYTRIILTKLKRLLLSVNFPCNLDWYVQS